MRPLVFAALFLAAIAPGFSQTTENTGPSLPNDPHAVLNAALPLYDFNSPELKPWHLKASYRFYDSNGKPTDEGKWEYWWASPQVHRSSWTLAGAESTTWSSADGSVYEKKSGNSLRYFERTIADLLISPLDGRALLDSTKTQLDLKMFPPNKPELACVIATPASQGKHKRQSPNPDTARQYCFEPQTMALRVAYSNFLTKQYSDLVKTQGRYIARQVIVKYGDQTLFSVSVDAIDGCNPTDAEFTPPPDAHFETHIITPQENDQNDVAVGILVKKTVPVYPAASKANGEQGVVLLSAVIDTSGKVQNLEALASPSPALAQAALDAVRTWEYKPYLLNGQPVEVETTINVIFTLGGSARRF